MRTFLKQKLDDTTKDKAGIRPKTSCSVTNPPTDGNPAYWTASFEDGEAEVGEVELWGEFYHTIWDRAMFGV